MLRSRKINMFCPWLPAGVANGVKVCLLIVQACSRFMNLTTYILLAKETIFDSI